MKLHADKPHQLSITAHGPGWVSVNGKRHERSLLLSTQGLCRDWAPLRFEALQPSHFEQLLAGEDVPPELLIFGSGPRLRFAPPVCLRALIERGIGVETMDTAAACRTYNILASEGRRVIAALLIHA